MEAGESTIIYQESSEQQQKKVRFGGFFGNRRRELRKATCNAYRGVLCGRAIVVKLDAVDVDGVCGGHRTREVQE